MTTSERPPRHRGIFRLGENVLAALIRLPEGQRIIGFRPDFARLCIDVCVEGDGLPVVHEYGEPPFVNAEEYLPPWPHLRWAMRGPELAEQIATLIEGWDEQRDGFDAGDVLDRLRQVLAGEDGPTPEVVP